MAVTAGPFGAAMGHFGNARINFGSATVKAMLTTSSYTINVDSHDYIDDVSANQITGTGYTAGGKALTSVVWAYDSATNTWILTAAPTIWTTATFTARRAVVYVDTGTPSTSPLLSWVDFGADQSPVAQDFPINWDATDGILAAAAV